MTATLPSPLGADDDLATARKAALDAVHSAIDLLILVERQHAESSNDFASDVELSECGADLKRAVDFASNAIQQVAADLIRTRLSKKKPVPAWCNERDSFAIGAAFAFANSVLREWMLVPGEPDSSLLVVIWSYNPGDELRYADDPDYLEQFEIIRQCRLRLAEYVRRHQIPEFKQIASEIDAEISAAKLARAVLNAALKPWRRKKDNDVVVAEIQPNDWQDDTSTALPNLSLPATSTTSSKVQPAAPAGFEGEDVDQIEEALSGQMLKIYRLLRDRPFSTAYDTLLESDLWTTDSPDDGTVLRALRRLRDEPKPNRQRLPATQAVALVKSHRS